ncbi:Gfo/Idh/MocA family oxidoreductase [Paenibacillus sp. IB182496]|uniref:Gfo/Idh/MocA family oxidoreductase n=1 Tax=Paenibacillus sabuli TaxID=2772509 RepID=A0A927BP78_9BACL|nr:Gfo/Idh/MocA family oxidoreductase [Paenibacillus sabuli]MBD2844197.1 Gfo/Idh/MocA family oxidoreductase [Paenibacillus sabuli]
MDKPIKGAVIGYGGAFNMGLRHAQYMLQHGIAFAAACDLDPERVEQAKQDFPNIDTYTSVEELLANDEINLVTVITPHHTHAQLAEQILEAGKHCILEKPMCIHADDAERLVQLARARGLMLSVYHNRRWDGWYLTVKDLIAKGIIGDVFHVEMFSGGYSEPKAWWRSIKEVSGGVFYDWGAHYVDYLLGIMPGPVTGVRGYIHNRVWDKISNEDQMDSIISFASGAVANVQISTIAHAGRPAFRLLGSKGAIVDQTLGDGELTLYTELEGVKIETKVPCQPSQQERYYANIADHLMRGADLIVKPEQARRTIAIIETTEKSALAGRELDVPYEQV